MFVYSFASPLKVVTTKKWEPFNMVVNGRLEGIGIDFWNIVAKDLNIDYVYESVDSWREVLKNIKTQKADLTLSTDMTDERKRYAIFSKPYVSFPLVIATKNNIGFIFDVRYIKNKTIAVGKNYTAAELMRKKYPALNYVYVGSTDEALDLVKKGEVFGAVDILPVIAYKINKYEYDDLKISGQIPVYFHVRFMLSKKNVYLLNMINRAIDNITIKQKEKIYDKYINTLRSDRMVFSSSEMLFYFLILVSFVNIIMLWVYFLKKELNALKKEKYNTFKSGFDRLTGVFKREKAEEIIAQKLQNKEEFSLIVFDIRDFKSVNRFYGHHFGDITLLELSSLVNSLLKQNEVLARLKGGTFIIVTDETEIKACERAKHILKSIDKFEFSIVKNLYCTFVVKTFYPDGEKEDVLTVMEHELQKVKKQGVDFKC
jgi:polar amino acid transport system substrate-binding protein